MIDYCLEKGIEPNVTLFHYDLPNVLAEEGGWENRSIVDDFEAYAKVCFEAFGDRVKLWSTINEPKYYAYCTNMVGNFPRTTSWTLTATLSRCTTKCWPVPRRWPCTTPWV